MNKSIFIVFATWFLFGCTNKDIKLVQEASIDGTQYTYKQVLNNVPGCDNPTWKTEKDDKDRNIVVFSCDIKSDGDLKSMIFSPVKDIKDKKISGCKSELDWYGIRAKSYEEHYGKDDPVSKSYQEPYLIAEEKRNDYMKLCTDYWGKFEEKAKKMIDDIPSKTTAVLKFSVVNDGFAIEQAGYVLPSKDNQSLPHQPLPHQIVSALLDTKNKNSVKNQIASAWKTDLYLALRDYPSLSPRVCESQDPKSNCLIITKLNLAANQGAAVPVQNNTDVNGKSNQSSVMAAPSNTSEEQDSSPDD